jgi:hypothetical protein
LHGICVVLELVPFLLSCGRMRMLGRAASVSIGVALAGGATPASADGPAEPAAAPPPSGASFGPLLAPLTPRDAASDSAGALGSWGSRPAAVLLHGGSAGGPLGFGGLSFEYAPVPWFIAGAGAGFSGGGPTAAIMPRLRLPLTRWFAIGAGVPVSVGPYVAQVEQPQVCTVGCEVGFTTTRTWSMAVWLHLEPNIELRLPMVPAMALRLYGGGSFLVNPHDDRCTSTLSNGCPSSIGEQTWYGGVAMGYAW